MAAFTTIDNPELYFQCKIWSGNATDDTSITLDGSENMQPDFVWTKRRNASTNHDLWDAVRGALEQMASNNNEAEATISSSLKSFNSDGFTVGTNTNLNASGGTYVAWCWKESATAGFDILTYTGNATNRTISHNLSAVPQVVIVKRRDSATAWSNLHLNGSGSTHRMVLNDNTAKEDDATFWQDTDPTSSVFSLGTSSSTNVNTGTYVAYCFAEKQGFSKFGTYVGNGNNSGPYVYTGFRPAMVICKGLASNREWVMHDNKRDAENVVDGTLYANETDAEGTGTARMDFLSNGFKIREDGNNWNANTETYIYMAFAEQPFVNSNGVPGNAR